jgi:GT2 family glycosyltransferase
VPDAVAYHVGSATTGKNSDFAVYHGHRNLVWTYVKNMPGWLFWLYLPQHVAANLYIIARYAFQRRGRIILKAKWDAIRKLPQMWQKRRAIQARRAVGAWEIRSVMEKGWPRRRQG